MTQPIAIPMNLAIWPWVFLSIEPPVERTRHRERCLALIDCLAAAQIVTFWIWRSLDRMASISLSDVRFSITADTACDLAFCYCRAEERHPARLVTPQEVRVEIRGGGNATRQIHHMLTPEFPAHRLLVVEVFTPAGNWSSYPPHKHDVHHPPGEVDLEEIYYYRLDRPEGYAIQKVYSADRRIDETDRKSTV